MLRLYRPSGKCDSSAFPGKPLKQDKYLALFSEGNPVLSSLIAERFQFGNPPSLVNPVICKVLSLDQDAYFHTLLKLGLCFCYSLADEVLANQDIAGQLDRVDKSLRGFFQATAPQFGEFYEPLASETLSKVFFDDDEFLPDVASVGLSLFYGYLLKNRCLIHKPLAAREVGKLHSIKQVRDVPIGLDQDPTGDILNRIISVQ